MTQLDETLMSEHSKAASQIAGAIRGLIDALIDEALDRNGVDPLDELEFLTQKIEEVLKDRR